MPEVNMFYESILMQWVIAVDNQYVAFGCTPEEAMANYRKGERDVCNEDNCMCTAEV